MTVSPCHNPEALQETHLLYGALTGEIIAAAVEVHRELGPGMLESAYHACLCHELALRRLHFQREVALPVEYKGIHLDCGYRMDSAAAEFLEAIAFSVRSVFSVVNNA